ncbi:MAG: hypothetical protein U5L96_21865 [Owenweeksia sp.]|nr:hypothetical protein [Owenweeksia sp.]
MEFTHIEDTFINIGGQFYTSAFNIQEKLQNIKAYLFDWDGVFNDGRKGDDHVSDFSEIDSVGVNMLLFGHFLTFKHQAKIALISHENDPICHSWASREGLDEVYLKATQKEKALAHFCDVHDLTPDNVVYVYDDVSDVPVAAQVGLRMVVGRQSNPVFQNTLSAINWWTF